MFCSSLQPTLVTLAHHLVFGSDTICSNPSPRLADIVRFGPLRIVVNLTVLKTCLLERDFHTLVESHTDAITDLNLQSHVIELEKKRDMNDGVGIFI